MSLTNVEKTILLEMLDQLRDHQANAGCNDYEIDDTPENRDFSAAVDMHFDREPEAIVQNGVIYLNDYEITSYLISRIKGEVKS